jgi:LPXTG-site transpeptidase (sortase) family protein
MTQGPTNAGKRYDRVALGLVAAGAAILAGTAVFVVLLLTGVIGGDTMSGPDTVVGFGTDSYVLTPAPTVTPSAVPPSNAPIARLVIPKAGVDAPVNVKGVDANNVMETPDGAWDVVWYDFSSKPGWGSNAVFSGHVDYHDVGPAVFWNLGDLVQNDVIEVRLGDGSDYKYRVVSSNSVSGELSGDQVRDIVGATPREIVTLITCTGTFNSDTHQYDKRLIVRAERIMEPAAPGGAPSAAGATQ